MTEWSVVLVIVALIGLGVTVGTPMIKLVKTIIALDLTLKHLREDIQSFKSFNDDEHNELKKQQEFMTGELSDHDKRLHSLEIKAGINQIGH